MPRFASSFVAPSRSMATRASASCEWSTDLDRGINQLTLPVVAIDATGGQVLVEVTHGDKRRTFVLDVRAAAAG